MKAMWVCYEIQELKGGMVFIDAKLDSFRFDWNLKKKKCSKSVVTIILHIYKVLNRNRNEWVNRLNEIKFWKLKEEQHYVSKLFRMRLFRIDVGGS